MPAEMNQKAPQAHSTHQPLQLMRACRSHTPAVPLPISQTPLHLRALVQHQAVRQVVAGVAQ